MRSRVVFADPGLLETFKGLEDSRSEEKELHGWLNRAFDDIAENCFCGIQIPKKQIPKKYLRDYDIENLWKYDLPRGWRLLYSVARDEVIIVAIVLEWMSHKDYERRFGT